MEFFEVLKQRYSVRGFKSDDIPEEKLQRVLEAARLAPTACNKQPFQLIVIHTRGRENEMMQIYDQEWFHQAPLVIGICAVPEKAWLRHDGKCYADVDCTIAMDHLILAAADQGLGTCWIGAFNVPATRAILGLPDEVEPLAFTPLGYPDKEPWPTKRRELSDLVHYEKW